MARLAVNPKTSSSSLARQTRYYRLLNHNIQRWWHLCLVLICCNVLSVKADTIYVAVASNFASTARVIASEFESATGHEVRLSFGSSGKLYAQIIHGAPFSVFLSADQAKPEALERAGLVAARQTYAIGHLVIWIPQPTVGSWQSQLADPNLGKIAMANPRLAPYGAAALQTLNHLQLETTRERWITGENIAQTFQFVSSGNAAAGFIAQSQLPAAGVLKGLVAVIPAHLHDPIRQDAVLLGDERRKPAAQAFYEFLLGPASQQLIKADGYGLVLTEDSN